MKAAIDCIPVCSDKALFTKKKKKKNNQTNQMMGQVWLNPGLDEWYKSILWEIAPLLIPPFSEVKDSLEWRCSSAFSYAKQMRIGNGES